MFRLCYIHTHLSRIPPSAPSQEPATFIARALHRRLPERIQGAGTLYLWLRPGRAAARIAAKLREASREHALIEHCAKIPLGEREVQICTAELVDALAPGDAEQTRALFMAGDREPELPDFARMTTLHALDVLARSGWLLDQMAEGRFPSFFHPTVHARDPSRIFAHEALLRGVERDGSLVAPQPILTLAREAGLLGEVDFAAVRSAIRETARHGPGTSVFINFTPAAVHDPDASLKSVLAAIEEAGLPRERVVFEVV